METLIRTDLKMAWTIIRSVGSGWTNFFTADNGDTVFIKMVLQSLKKYFVQLPVLDAHFFKQRQTAENSKRFNLDLRYKPWCHAIC